MNESRLWRWSLIAVLTLAAAGLWHRSSQSATAESARMAAPGGTVATLDLNSVLENLEERQERERELMSMIEERQARLKAMENQLQQSQSDLKILAEKSKEWFAQREQTARLSMALRIEQEIAKGTVDEKRKNLSFELFSKINDAAARYAAREGISVVISSDIRADIPFDASEQQFQAAMVSRRVLYASESTDISQAVAQMMNNEHKAK